MTKQSDQSLAIAREFVNYYNIICFNKHFYYFKEKDDSHAGIWRLESDENTEAWITTDYIKKFSTAPSSQVVREIVKYITSLTLDKYHKKIKYLSEQHISNTINVKSGILNLDTLEIKPYEKDDFCFYKLPFDFVREPKCPVMMKFLTSSMNFNLETDDAEDYRKVMKFIQEWLGYSLIAGNRFQKCLIMLGEGGNGKGVLQDIWEYIIGKYNCSYVDLGNLNDGSQIFMTRNKLVNFSKDLESNLQFDTGTVKSAVAGETVISNEKFKGQVEMTFTAKIVIACNELPWIRNASVAVKRRIHLLPFTRTFSEDERDINLFVKLKTEADQIFSWAVIGLKNLNERGKFDVPDRCAYSLATYIKNNDSIQIWLDEGEVIKIGEKAKCSEIYNSYKSYCLDSGLKPYSRNKFYDRLELKGIKKEKGHANVLYFVDMKSPYDIN